MTPTHPPTPEQIERLAILAEECAEVIQVVGKILRHGWRSDHFCNRIALEHELGDLQWAVGLLYRSDDVEMRSVDRFTSEKPVKAAPWLHHN